MTSAISLMTSLYKLDRSEFTVRDVLTLYAIITNKGCSGLELAKKLGYPARSGVQDSLKRLQRTGMIVDHRQDQRRTSSCSFHATDEGRKFWNGLLTAGE